MYNDLAFWYCCRIKTVWRFLLQDLDNKIRGTRKIYKEIKKFFAEYLQQTKDPVIFFSYNKFEQMLVWAFVKLIFEILIWVLRCPTVFASSMVTEIS